MGLVEAAGGRCAGVWGAWSMWLGCREGGWTETQHPATHGPARPLKLGMQVWTGWGCPADSSLLFFVKTIFLLCIRVQPTTNVVAEAPQRGSATRGHASALPQTPPVQAAPAGRRPTTSGLVRSAAHGPHPSDHITGATREMLRPEPAQRKVSHHRTCPGPGHQHT